MIHGWANITNGAKVGPAGTPRRYLLKDLTGGPANSGYPEWKAPFPSRWGKRRLCGDSCEGGVYFRAEKHHFSMPGPDRGVDNQDGIRGQAVSPLKQLHWSSDGT